MFSLTLLQKCIAIKQYKNKLFSVNTSLNVFKITCDSALIFYFGFNVVHFFAPDHEV